MPRRDKMLSHAIASPVRVRGRRRWRLARPLETDRGSFSGQAVQFRVIRYNWQSDNFTASMLPLAERTARPMARGNVEEVERRRRFELLEWSARAPSLDRSENARAWTAKGYSMVSQDAANELNEWLKSKTEVPGDSAVWTESGQEVEEGVQELAEGLRTRKGPCFHGSFMIFRCIMALQERIWSL